VSGAGCGDGARPDALGVPEMNANRSWAALAAACLVAACPQEKAPPPPAVTSPLTPIAAPPSKPKPPFVLPPELVEALRGVDWEVLAADEKVPDLAYRVPADCKLEYIDLGRLTISEDGVAGMEHAYYQPFVLEKAGAGRQVRRPGRRLDFVRVAAYGKAAEGFVDPGAQRAQPVALEVGARDVRFPSVLSPIFQMHRGAAFGQSSPMSLWPTLPEKGSAKSEWRYSLLFDTPERLRTQPPAQVALVGWVRLSLQRAAYLTATWPEGAPPVAIGTDLANMQVGKRMPVKSTLASSGEVKGHYLVSENGYVALAHVEGIGRVRNVFKVGPDKKGQPTEREFPEDRIFSFTTKLLSDCTGSLFSRTDAKELGEAETGELVERFASLLAVDRASEAMALCSPAIRYAFPGGAPPFLLREHVQNLGAESFGKPVAAKPPAQKPAHGVLFEGTSKKTGRKTYSLVIAESIGGQRLLSFIGSSSKPDRKSWDLLSVAPGNIHSGVLRVIRAPR
jgi:hypothetical protein